MTGRLKYLFDRLTIALRRFIIPAALFVIYFIGLGFMKVVLVLLRLNFMGARGEVAKSLWREADECDPEAMDVTRQS